MRGSSGRAVSAFDCASLFCGRGRHINMREAHRLSRQRCRESGMHKLIDRFRREQKGAALVEYGLLVGLIAVICVVAVTTLGTEVSTAFSNIASALSAF
jgi:pilus assembly protein Flp/PilA